MPKSDACREVKDAKGRAGHEGRGGHEGRQAIEDRRAGGQEDRRTEDRRIGGREIVDRRLL